MSIHEHNEAIRCTVSYMASEIKRLQKKIELNKKDLKPPCQECPYDGVFRCEACREAMYIGFNKKDFPGGEFYGR